MKERKSKQPPHLRQKRRLSGTREWATTNINIQTGCKHGCLYCYARYDAVHRYKQCSAEQWAVPRIRQSSVERSYGKYDGTVMFPSTHDITPVNLEQCIIVLQKLLKAGNNVLIVSKPHWQCIPDICELFKPFVRQVTFRFTIGSASSDILRFWEPGAPTFFERKSCLEYAFNTGYQTSVSCEPFLDARPQHVYDAVKHYLTDSFWLGLMRRRELRVDLDALSDEQIDKYIEPVRKAQSRDCVMAYYQMFKDRPYVKFKDSFRAVVEKFYAATGSGKVKDA